MVESTKDRTRGGDHGELLARGRKSTQRERLLAGMVTSANRDGYTGANVSKIIAEAGVSRPTFYDYFEDKDDCFLAALHDIQQRLLGEVRDVGDRPPEHALQANLAAIVRSPAASPRRRCSYEPGDGRRTQRARRTRSGDRRDRAGNRGGAPQTLTPARRADPRHQPP